MRDERVAARERHEDERAEDHEVRTVRRRLAVMRTAVDVLVDEGDEHLAERVERAMHARELILEGRDDPEAMEIRESAPDRGELAELLAHAARLHEERGHTGRAEALEGLSEVYGRQWHRARQARREGRAVESEARSRERRNEREPRDEREGLDDLARRLEILRSARRVHDRAGDEDASAYLERVLHVGELQHAGASPDELERAMEGLSVERMIELLRRAARLHGANGDARSARLCAALAGYYARREAGRDSARAHEEDVSDLTRRMRALQEEIQELEARLEAIRRVR